MNINHIKIINLLQNLINDYDSHTITNLSIAEIYHHFLNGFIVQIS